MGRVVPAKPQAVTRPPSARVMAPVTALTETFVRPDWIDKVRKDPATLRSKLAGTQDLWRIRVGDYRVVCVTADHVLVVTVVRAGHRREVYRR